MALPVRILHIITSLSTGGAEMMLTRLVSTSDPRRFQHAVVSLHGVGSHGPELQAKGIQLWSLDATGLLSTPLAMLRVSSIIRRFRPDIIQSWLYHADLFTLILRWICDDARRAAWCCNIRCVQTSTSASSALTRLALWTLGKTSDRSAAILTNSIAGLEHHRTRYGYHPRRWLIVPNGFDLEAYRPDPASAADVRHELGLPPETRILAMVARMDHLKDHPTFLSALAAIRDLQRPVHGVLIGRGATRNHPVLSSHMARLGLEGRVSCLGERQDVSRLMAAADVAVLTSTSEGFPNVLGEAMACGTPCVSTNVGAAAAIIGNTGMIVPIGDSLALAAGVIRLLDEPEPARQNRRDHARQRIASAYSLTRSVSIYDRIYTALAARRPCRFHGDSSCAG